jgi:hypothetical protein
VFYNTPVQLNEESTGPYRIDSLDVSLPGLREVRFVPRGIFMVGARSGRRLSRLGRQTLVWLEAGGSLNASVDPDQETETVIGRSFFPNATEGWFWSDTKHTEVRPLSEAILWDRVLTSDSIANSVRLYSDPPFGISR